MFLGPHKMKMSHYFSVFNTLWNLGLFWFLKTPPLILDYSQLKLGTFWIFWGPPPLFGLIPKFRCFFDWKASLRLLVQLFVEVGPGWKYMCTVFRDLKNIHSCAVFCLYVSVAMYVQQCLIFLSSLKVIVLFRHGIKQINIAEFSNKGLPPPPG